MSGGYGLRHGTQRGRPIDPLRCTRSHPALGGLGCRESLSLLPTRCPPSVDAGVALFLRATLIYIAPGRE